MKAVFITGGAGFIGSALICLLIAESDWTVVNIDKLTYAGNLESLTLVADSPRYRFAHADICDRAAMDALFAEHQPDGIIHLAAESHVDRSIHGPRDFVQTNITGTYPTPDGTGVRDYIHVVDLAQGHLRALEALQTRNGVHVWNLGTGHGYSVLEMVRAFEVASGKPVPYRMAPRRAGDIATCYADPAKAELELGWKAQRGLDEMMHDAWHWQSMNPDGYR